jgi:hypothetical protein
MPSLFEQVPEGEDKKNPKKDKRGKQVDWKGRRLTNVTKRRSRNTATETANQHKLGVVVRSRNLDSSGPTTLNELRETRHVSRGKNSARASTYRSVG